MLQPLRFSFSVASLIIANSVPLFGVLFYGWDLFTIFLLYWLESAVIGFYNVLKFTKAPGRFKLFFTLFFIFHYGIFMTVHVLFIANLFAPRGENFDASLLVAIGNGIKDVIPAIIVLFISHGISFYTNFIGKKEYLRTKSEDIMNAPYNRIIIMHVTIIFGGMLVQFFGVPIFGLVLLVLFKIGADLTAHVKAHKKVQAKPSLPTSEPQASKT